MDRHRLLPEEEDGDDIKGSTHLLGAIKTIIIADAVMSLDNVIALSAASAGDFFLVSLGVLISIPIIVWGSQLILRLIDRFPLIILSAAACSAGSPAACCSPTAR